MKLVDTKELKKLSRTCEVIKRILAEVKKYFCILKEHKQYNFRLMSNKEYSYAKSLYKMGLYK